jgi:hypothetical protein
MNHASTNTYPADLPELPGLLGTIIKHRPKWAYCLRLAYDDGLGHSFAEVKVKDENNRLVLQAVYNTDTGVISSCRCRFAADKKVVHVTDLLLDLLAAI